MQQISKHETLLTEYGKWMETLDMKIIDEYFTLFNRKTELNDIKKEIKNVK